MTPILERRTFHAHQLLIRSFRNVDVILDLGCCAIRPWRGTDAASLAELANNRSVWRNMRDRFPHPYTIEDANEWIRLNLEDSAPLTNFAITVDDAVADGIGLLMGTDVERRSAEIGYWLGEPYWGRGLATAAVEAMTGWGFANFDLVRIHAGVYEWNPASARVLEKVGYKLEARLRKSVTKDGHTIDRLVYAQLREAEYAEQRRVGASDRA